MIPIIFSILTWVNEDGKYKIKVCKDQFVFCHLERSPSITWRKMRLKQTRGQYGMRNEIT